MLPAQLGHLASHMRIRRLNWMFPASVTVLTFAAGCWIARAAETERAGFALLAAITLLALIEHWLMVLPLPDEKLWRWAMPAPNQDTTRRGRSWITTRSSRPSSTI